MKSIVKEPLRRLLKEGLINSCISILAKCWPKSQFRQSQTINSLLQNLTAIFFQPFIQTAKTAGNQRFLKHSLESILQIVYPSHCFHCESPLDPELSSFCPSCIELLTPLSSFGRCQICFGSLKEHLRKSCHAEFPFEVAYPFEKIGPPASLVREIKSRSPVGLIEASSGYMALLLSQLPWDLPDGIVVRPSSFFYRLFNGKSPSLKLAQALGRLVGRPVISPKAVQGKKVLYLGLELSPIWIKEGEVLLSNGAKKIYGLTFCGP